MPRNKSAKKNCSSRRKNDCIDECFWIKNHGCKSKAHLEKSEEELEQKAIERPALVGHDGSFCAKLPEVDCRKIAKRVNRPCIWVDSLNYCRRSDKRDNDSQAYEDLVNKSTSYNNDESDDEFDDESNDESNEIKLEIIWRNRKNKLLQKERIIVSNKETLNQILKQLKINPNDKDAVYGKKFLNLNSKLSTYFNKPTKKIIRGPLN